jgi:sugar/nucleoside kinase (ribokinase family)
MDRLRKVSGLPISGGYVEVDEEICLLGGEAANTANALCAWGDAVDLTGNPVGTSEEAQVVRRLLSERGLHLFEQVSADVIGEPLVTPVCDIYITPDGDRTMFGKGFASLERHISLESMPWKAGSWFTADPNIDHASREAARRAASIGMNCYLMDFIRPDDPVPPGSFWQSSTDWAGHRNNMQRNLAWVRRWIADHGCFTILSDGPNGFVAGSPESGPRAYPPFPAPIVVDTTGAGDMFRAGMLHGLTAGWPITDALRFASAAGCLKCRYLGATAGVPTIQEIETLIADNPDVSRQYG